jgi:hypothetical protein
MRLYLGSMYFATIVVLRLLAAFHAAMSLRDQPFKIHGIVTNN